MYVPRGHPSFYGPHHWFTPLDNGDQRPVYSEEATGGYLKLPLWYAR